MTPFLVLAGAALVAVLGVLIYKRWAQDEGDPIYCRCHACHKKVRFTADQGGRSANCPNCQKRWTIPSPGSAANQSQSGTAFTQPKPRVVIARKMAGSR